MLPVEPQLQQFLSIRIQRQQVAVTGRPAMHDASATIHRRINDGVPRPAIFRLHVIDLIADAYVRIVAEQNAQRVLTLTVKGARSGRFARI